tara:strand:- start:106 stop:2649 length:2544 start_codon:yes stop_codon:yes gene_type:complete
MLGVKAASLGKMGSHTLDGASHTDIAGLTEAKGDILVYNGSTWNKLAVGTNNYVLIADSSEATGLKWAADVTIAGDLTVSGDTVTANVATYQVEDTNMTLNNVGSPSDSNANGGGLTIKGTSDKTITFTNSTGDFDFSENVDIASGKTFKVNGTTVLSNNTLGSGVTSSSLTSLGTIATGVWNGTAIALAYGGTGLVGATDGKMVVADGSGAPVVVQMMTANDGTLKHEVGGIEADISGIAKGGLVVGTGTGSMDVKAVGTNDHVLTADSSQTGGVKWASVPTAAVTAVNNATANEIVTIGSTITELDAESTLTYDGAGDLEISAGSSGDPRITFDINGTDEWTIGVDDNDSDIFKIDTGAAVGGATKFSIDSSGDTVIAGGLTTGSTAALTSAGQLSVAAQPNVTSLGTLTALQVDYANLNASTLKITDSSDTGDYASLEVTTHGATTLTTVDDDDAAAHFSFDIDGNMSFDAHTGVFKFLDGAFGAEILRLTESGSGDVTVKLATDGKDLIFTDNGDAEGFRILDAAAGVTVAGKTQTDTIELGHASDTTIARASSGAITVEGSAVLLAGAQTGITTILNSSTKVGRDAHNLIDFTTDDNITFRAGDANQIDLVDGVLAPVADSDIDLGTSSEYFKDAYIDTITTTGTITTGDSVQTATVDFTDGDNAMTIADGGGVTFPVASTFTGGFTTNDDVNLAVQKVIKIGGTAEAHDFANDHTGTGISLTMEAGENLTLGSAVYVDSNGKAQHPDVDASGVTGKPAIGIAMSGASSGASVNVLVLGMFRDVSAYDFTPGAAVFMTGTDGALTTTASDTAADGDIVQRIGIAITADMLFVMPSIDEIEHA